MRIFLKCDGDLHCRASALMWQLVLVCLSADSSSLVCLTIDNLVALCTLTSRFRLSPLWTLLPCVDKFKFKFGCAKIGDTGGILGLDSRSTGRNNLRMRDILEWSRVVCRLNQDYLFSLRFIPEFNNKPTWDINNLKRDQEETRDGGSTWISRTSAKI